VDNPPLQLVRQYDPSTLVLPDPPRILPLRRRQAPPPAAHHGPAVAVHGDLVALRAHAVSFTLGFAVHVAHPRIEHVTELSPVDRLHKLRTLEEWLTWQLEHTRQKIKTLEEQAQAIGDYVTEPERRAGRAVGVTIHTATCPKIDRPAATLNATDAQYALVKDSSFNHPCENCRPDTALGLAN